MIEAFFTYIAEHSHGVSHFALYLPLFTIAYMIYLFSDKTRLVRKWAVRLGDKQGAWDLSGSDTGFEWVVYIQKFIGFLLLGPFLFVIATLDGTETGFQLPSGEGALWWTILPIVLVLVITIFRSDKGINTNFYPQVRRAVWNRKRVFLNALFWTLYLLGYEYAFRGFLLFPLIAEIGLVATVMLNASVYGLAHIYKGAGEAFGAFFLGILFCAIAIATNSFVIPFIMHIIMAIGNDMAALKKSSEMTLVK